MHKKALDPLVDNSTQILILGTMPGDQSIAHEQYYANKGNRFWKIMFTIFEEDFSSSYDNRKAFLKKHKIGLWHVLASCVREGSSDSKIKNEVANDFDEFHRQYPNIKHIFFESKSAVRFYQKHLPERNDISYHILPSTSGLNAGISLNEKIQMWKVLAQTALNLTQSS